LSASNRTILQSVLAADYDNIVRRLARRFGSADFARETLHETFVRLSGLSDQSELRNPRDYLFRAAINIGKNLRRNQQIRATDGEIRAFFEAADETPSPAQVIENRADMDVLLRVIAELPPRTRSVFEAVLFDETPHAQIALKLGVSLRTIERDVQRATEYCVRVLEAQGYGPDRLRN
jgi:RNA polymerase sigma-70 factor (ECF subfamily)